MSVNISSNVSRNLSSNLSTRHLLTLVVAGAVSLGAAGYHAGSSQNTTAPRSDRMELGAFSVSLTVKDLAASRAFYEKLGFAVVGGKAEHNWLILRNGTTTIGIFQGMFEKNCLTFNPGWSAKAENIEGEFTDVREIQRRLKEQGLTLLTEADELTTGPASATLVDPDGNPVLIDQHR